MIEQQPRPKVSVLILAYNHEKYLRETLEGAVNQVTNFPFEIHVHDDASTDGTVGIIKEFQARYPERIKPLFQKENQFSQNIKPLTKFIYPNLKSEYIAFCEGDDYWTDPDKLNKQVSFLDEHVEYSFCGHDVQMKYEEGMKVKERFYNKPKEGSFSFTFLEELENHFVATPTLVARREHVVSAPVSRNLVSADLYMLLYLLSRGKGYYMADKMVVKRRNKGGITVNPEYIKKVGRGQFLLWREVLEFTPRAYRLLVKDKLAQCERQLIKNSASRGPTSLTALLYSAILHDPFWLLGLSTWRRGRIWAQAKRGSS